MVFQDRPDRLGKADLRVCYFLPLALGQRLVKFLRFLVNQVINRKRKTLHKQAVKPLGSRANAGVNHEGPSRLLLSLRATQSSSVDTVDCTQFL